MTKIKSFLKFLLTNSVFATFLYFGAVQGISGFMNVLTFFIWFVFVIFLLSIPNEEVHKNLHGNSKNQFKLGVVGHLISAIYIGVLVFYGHILLGLIYLFTTLITYALYENGKKLVEGANF